MSASRVEAPSPFRVGIIGAGSIARRAHIPSWLSLEGVEVAALCDSDPAALDSAAREFGIHMAFRDYHELLALQLDAVSICTPNTSHFPVALAALEAGKHVLCEKPLTVSPREARILGERAEALGLTLMTQHQLRFSAAAAAARARADAGDLGFVYHARVRALRRDRVPTSPGFTELEQSGGGPALDLGIHSLDIALGLMGFPRPVTVSGAVRVNFAQGDRIPGHWGEWDRERFTVEDFAAGFVRFENGATLSLESSWIGHYAQEGLSCTLLGTEGSLEWPSGRFFSFGKAEDSPAADAGETENPHFAAIRAFYEAVREGKPSPVPWRETRASIAILCGLYRSAREGREVAVEIPAE